MKVYMKPDVEHIEFTAEAVMSLDNMGGDTTSTDETSPFVL